MDTKEETIKRLEALCNSRSESHIHWHIYKNAENQSTYDLTWINVNGGWNNVLYGYTLDEIQKAIIKTCKKKMSENKLSLYNFRREQKQHQEAVTDLLVEYYRNEINKAFARRQRIKLIRVKEYSANEYHIFINENLKETTETKREALEFIAGFAAAMEMFKTQRKKI